MVMLAGLNGLAGSLSEHFLPCLDSVPVTCPAASASFSAYSRAPGVKDMLFSESVDVSGMA